MPLEITPPPDTDVMSLEEFTETVDAAGYDFSREDDLIDCARFLRKLGNNRKFLLDRMFDELKSIADFQRTNLYGPQVFLLHSGKDYFVRANVWRPPSALEQSIKGFQYDICHDHNFDILTVGYFGPGYHSRCYTYEHEHVVGLLGEQIPLVAEGVFTLWQGRLALYRAKRDVHIQLPPDEISVSLNLIPRNERLRELQFQIDENSGRICRYLQSSGSELAVRLAGVLGDKSSLDLLAAIAETNPSAQLRALAIVSQLQIGRDVNPTSSDSSLVRDLVDKERLKYGSCLQMHTG